MKTFLLKPVVRQYVIVIAANLSGLGAGLCLAWSSPVLIKLEDRNSTVLSRPLTSEEATWLASISQLFCVIFLLVGSPIINRIGRKQGFYLLYLSKLIAGLLFIFGTEVWELMLARVCDGISLAFYYVVVSTYTAEIADKHIRGAMGAIVQITRSTGIMAMLGVAPFLSYTELHLSYLGLTAFSAIFLALLPETPYFLYSKGKIEESEKVLNSLRSTNQEIQEELQMFMDNENKDKAIQKHIRNKVFLKSMGISLILSAAGPGTGFTFVNFYLQNVMELSETSVKPAISSGIVGVVQWLACFPPLIMVDRFGRKLILIGMMLLISLGTTGLGTFFWCKEAGYQMNSFLNILPTLSASIINFGVAGYLSILFILVPELFIGSQRALGVSLSSLALSLGIFIVAKSYSALVSSLGFPISFWMFSAVSLSIALFVIFCIPETKGKRFDEIQNVLEGKVTRKMDEN